MSLTQAQVRRVVAAVQQSLRNEAAMASAKLLTRPNGKAVDTAIARAQRADGERRQLEAGIAICLSARNFGTALQQHLDSVAKNDGDIVTAALARQARVRVALAMKEAAR